MIDQVGRKKFKILIERRLGGGAEFMRPGGWEMKPVTKLEPGK